MNNDDRIVLYSKKNCPVCKKVKALLEHEKVEFSLCQDVEEMQRLGIKLLPTIKIGDISYQREEIFDNYMNWKPFDARKLMSDAKFYESYSRYLENEKRYETWEESVVRVMDMHRTFYKNKMTNELDRLINEVEVAYRNKLFLGAQRALQFGGEQLLKNHGKLYNCAGSHCNRPNFFGGYFYFLLCGCGVGFSVQKQHISQLPDIQQRGKTAKTYIVPDSIEGWATSIDVLLSSFFIDGGVYPEYKGEKVYFDLSNIRPKNSFISGGFKAPGSEPLRRALDKIEYLIEQKIKNGAKKLDPITAYDICMHIADAVISGGK